TAVPRVQGWVHSEDAFTRERHKRVVHELRPTDDEDQLRLELPEGIQRLERIDIPRLDEGCVEACRNVVERALPRAIWVARAGEGHDPDDLCPSLGGRLQAVAADRVEAHPDRAHRGAMLPGGLRRRCRGAAAPSDEADPAVTGEPDEEPDGAGGQDDDDDRPGAWDVQEFD